MNRTRMIETLKTHGLWDKLSSRTQMVLEEFRPQTPDNEEVGNSIAIVFDECRELLRDNGIDAD